MGTRAWLYTRRERAIVIEPRSLNETACYLSVPAFNVAKSDSHQGSTRHPSKTLPHLARSRLPHSFYLIFNCFRACRRMRPPSIKNVSKWTGFVHPCIKCTYCGDASYYSRNCLVVSAISARIGYTCSSYMIISFQQFKVHKYMHLLVHDSTAHILLYKPKFSERKKNALGKTWKPPVQSATTAHNS